MLEVKKLTKSFQGQSVIRDFNARFGAGVHLILGRNGSGKTTLLNLISNILQMDQGSAEFDGASLKSEGKKYLANIALATSNSDSFFQQLTGLENLEFFSLVNELELNLGEFKRTHPSFYEILSPLLEKRFHTFSSGMRRKLSLFRALLQKRKIMILDEPFMHLDERATNELVKYIKADSERIYLIATHRKDLFLDMKYQEWEM